MYKQFFGLRENPFNVNPDPRFLFLTPQTQEALDELTYGIQARKGLILLTGQDDPSQPFARLAAPTADAYSVHFQFASGNQPSI